MNTEVGYTRTDGRTDGRTGAEALYNIIAYAGITATLFQQTQDRIKPIYPGARYVQTPFPHPMGSRHKFVFNIVVDFRPVREGGGSDRPILGPRCPPYRRISSSFAEAKNLVVMWILFG